MEHTGDYYKCNKCSTIWDYNDLCPECGSDNIEDLNDREAHSEMNTKIHQLQKENAELREIMIWVLGYNDFPAKGASDGNYYWRSHLRKKLKDSGIEINPPDADDRK